MVWILAYARPPFGQANPMRIRRASQEAATPPDPLAAGCAWIDGQYVPVGAARIPILDVGFVRSDLTYDVVAVWEGRFFRLDDHLDRLFAGCRRIRLTPPLAKADIRAIRRRARSARDGPGS